MESELKYKTAVKKKWLVVYVRPRWERKVGLLLEEHGIESFCPTSTKENQWADRKKLVTTPLFSGYVFVRISDRDLSKVRYTIGVLNYIYFMGKPASIRDVEIERLKTIVNGYENLEVVALSALSTGDRVRIKSGLFHNQEGNIIQILGKKVLMSFDHLDCALVTRISVSSLIKTDQQNILNTATSIELLKEARC
ncbi:MAG: UpxY family transcription antiterminator [Pedobacter sp.]|nr:MAG: UpxY family transcription antiterminator [Pedobacter sp.]